MVDERMDWHADRHMDGRTTRQPDGVPDGRTHGLSHMHVSNALRAQYILLLFVVNFP